MLEFLTEKRNQFMTVMLVIVFTYHCSKLTVHNFPFEPHSKNWCSFKMVNIKLVIYHYIHWCGSFTSTHNLSPWSLRRFNLSIHHVIAIQNETPPHWEIIVRKRLDGRFPNKWISRGGEEDSSIKWVARGCILETTLASKVDFNDQLLP